MYWNICILKVYISYLNFKIDFHKFTRNEKQNNQDKNLKYFWQPRIFEIVTLSVLLCHTSFYHTCIYYSFTLYSLCWYICLFLHQCHIIGMPSLILMISQIFFYFINFHLSLFKYPPLAWVYSALLFNGIFIFNFVQFYWDTVDMPHWMASLWHSA